MLVDRVSGAVESSCTREDTLCAQRGLSSGSGLGVLPPRDPGGEGA